MHPVDALYTPLAQAGQPAANPRGLSSGVVLWVVVLIAVLLAGFLLLMWLKRRIFSTDSAQEQTGGLMDGLKHMRDTGQISKEEYDATRKAMIDRMAKSDLGAAKKTPNRGLESR